MEYLTVHDWEEHQTYRKDRQPPPWIKVHRRLFMSRKWAMLTDAEKGQLVSLWILAADRHGVIPGDPAILRKLAMLDAEPNISKFIDLGLLASDWRHDGVNVASSGCQSDAPEAEAEAEAEKSRDTRKPQKRGQRLPTDWKPSKQLLQWAVKERSDLDMVRVIDSFTDYWQAKTGASATKLDWDATFRNWVRNEKRSRTSETTVQARERRNRAALGL